MSTSPPESAKFNMIEQQVRPWEVLDTQVLAALSSLERAHFVPETYRGLAYADCQIRLDSGLYMLPPNIEGRMLQALLIKPEDNVLELGCTCGYLTACLARLAGQVTSLAASESTVEIANRNIAPFGFSNIKIKQGSFLDLADDQSFDVIAVTASLPQLPDHLQHALTVGGRMFVVVGEAPAMQALLITRVGDSEWTRQSLFETVLPRLGG